jgi:ADP-ribose pyrophosphatase YjhB (NUDIX family)
VSALQKLSRTFLTTIPHRHRACSCGATVKTKDGKYLLVKLNGKSMNTSEYELVGGNTEEPHPMETGEDLFEHLYREASEESALEKSDFANLILKAVIQAQRGLSLFYFDGTLNITEAELMEKFKAQKEKDHDVSSLVFMSREEYLAHLENSGRVISRVLRGLV